MTNALFKKLKTKETKDILSVVNQHTELSDFQPERTVIMAQGLSFYPGYRLLDISDLTEVPEKRVYGLINEKKESIILDFTNGPVYAVNENAPISLDTGVVSDYVRFFFNFVRGSYGRFILAETLDDIKWQEEPPINARKAISKMLVPLTLIEKTATTYIMEASFIFRDSLIKAKLDITDKGIIKMYDEEIIIEDMPTLDEDLDV